MSTKVETQVPSFLTTDILKSLGRDGFIIMIVGCVLVLILIICIIALIVWYCKSTRSKTEDDVNPRIGIIVPSIQKRQPQEPTLSPTTSTLSPASTARVEDSYVAYVPDPTDVDMVDNSPQHSVQELGASTFEHKEQNVDEISLKSTGSGNQRTTIYI